MKKDYERSLARVLVYEGGKVDDPHDPGGRTNQGVTQKVYDAYRKRRGKRAGDVYRMTGPERDEIYRVQYWEVVKGDQLPVGIDFVVFDGAVNSGCAQSVKWLQRSLPGYTGAVDGQLGLKTLAAVQAVNDHDDLIARICDRRTGFLRHLSTYRRFGNGWTRRVRAVRGAGQAWASGSVPVKAEPIPFANAKAMLDQAVPIPTRAPFDAAAASGGTVAGGAEGVNYTLTSQLDAAREQLAPFADTIRVISWVLLAITIAGACVGIGGLGWGWYARRRAAARRDALDLDAVTDRSRDPVAEVA